MSEFVLWPYDEVTIKRDNDSNSVVVQSPWIKATIKIDDQNRLQLEELVQKFSGPGLVPGDLKLVNWLFQELRSFPLSYILPSKKNSPTLDKHTTQDDVLSELPLPEFLQSVLGSWPEGGSKPEDSAKIVETLARPAWDWDIDSALAFSTVDGMIHPESVFSVARRFHLIDVIQSNQARENFNSIENLIGKPEFASAVALMVRQNHYITQRCRSSLMPALQTSQSAKTLVEEFIREENGHDKILGVALNALVQDPEAVAVSLQSKAVMHLLGFSGQRNFLGFAMAVDCFERSTYENVDPLAALLRKGGFEKAAKQVNRHKEINDAGEHENVACELLKFMAPVSTAYAKEALRIAEMVTLVVNSVAQSAVDLYQRR